MESVLSRYKNLIILVGVLFLQVLGLAVQVKRSGEAENTRLIRIWAVDAITPFERGVIWLQNGVSGLWHNYFYLRGVRTENRQLREQIEQMRLEQVRLKEDAAQAQRLQALLAFKEQVVTKTVAAQVIGSSASDLSRIVYIDKGEDDGLKRDMAVITADGIVGKVLQVFPSVAQVLLINDQSSGVGVILEKTRLQGVLRGMANGEVVLERVMSDEQVPVGEKVLTSGGDQIFPKGLPVGTVTKVGPGIDLFLSIKVKPAADLSKLEEVLVLVEKQERQAPAEVASHVRAADILAQRLPSVPDKPATDANGAPVAKNAPAGAAAPGSASTGAKPSAQPKTEVKPTGGTVTKPETPAGSVKPAGAGGAQTKPASTNTNATATASGPSVKKVASTSGTPDQAIPGQAATAGSGKQSAPKTVAPSGASTNGTSAIAPGKAKPADLQPKPVGEPEKPAAAPTSPQPPAADDNPH
jgi:rod shape-determining protein MreC